MTMRDIIERLKSQVKQAVPVEGLPPMTFTTSFAEVGVSSYDLNILPFPVPSDLNEFWRLAREASLFVDREYGQWGLDILNPHSAVAETKELTLHRSADFIRGDLIVGKFRGDSDFVLVRCDLDSEDFGTVLIALPLEGRSSWYRAGTSFRNFLERYMMEHGEKFWERS